MWAAIPSLVLCALLLLSMWAAIPSVIVYSSWSGLYVDQNSPYELWPVAMVMLLFTIAQVVKETWKDIDVEEAHDPLFSSEYAPGIYVYTKQREIQ